MVGLAVINSVLFIWCVDVAFGEPRGYDYGPVKNKETEVEIQKVEVYEVPWVGDQPAQNSYGPPPTIYYAQAEGPPSQPPQEYGPPGQEHGTTEYPDLTTTTLLPPVNSTITTSNNSTQNQTARLEESSDGVKGQYYIYHPNGLLQKVIYLAEDDSKNMAFTARLQYKNVDLIKGPIYTYDPNTYVFSRLNRK